MKRLLHLTPDHYWIDSIGVRTTCFGQVHYPDYCPYYTNEQFGNCLKKCGSLELTKRPCWQAMYKDTNGTRNKAFFEAKLI